jgi:hypothetical protein
MSSNKRKSLTALQKKEICLAKQIAPFPTNQDLANAYDIGKSTVGDILREKEKWLTIDDDSSDANKKKRRNLLYDDVDQALAIWVEQALNAGLDLSGDILKEKAVAFAELLNKNGFKASDGWLSGFKERHNIKEYVKHGEAGSAPILELPTYREQIKSITSQYQLSDIFNADETGLFWKLEPSRVLSTGPVAGRKKSKERITIMLTCNANGTEKLKPLLIHKYQNPRAIINVNKDTLKVKYYWNIKAWMQTSIFNDYLKDLNNEMKKQNRNILLLLDNAPTHSISESTNLTNVRVYFLPPNTTAFLQPCDAGIINSFKVNYKKLFLQKKISDYEEERNGQEYEKISIKHAIKFTAKAWKKVTSQTIVNCWKKTGILPDYDINSNEIENMSSTLNSLNVREFNDLQNLIDELALPNPISASEYIEIDDSHVSDELNLNDIVTIINPPEENEGQEEIIEELPPVTNKEALSAIKTLEIYIDQQSELNEDDFKLLKSLKRKIKKIDFNSQQQSTLDSFFNI